MADHGPLPPECNQMKAFPGGPLAAAPPANVAVNKTVRLGQELQTWACDGVPILEIVDLKPKVAGTAVASVVLIMAACSTNPQPEPGPPSSAVIRPTSRTPTTPPPTAPTLACGDYIDTAAPPEDWQVVLGVVALPSSPRSAALQTSPTGETGPYRLVAKTGLLIKPGASFELVVPDEFTGRLGIGWANGPAIPASSLRAADREGQRQRAAGAYRSWDSLSRAIGSWRVQRDLTLLIDQRLGAVAGRVLSMTTVPRTGRV